MLLPDAKPEICEDGLAGHEQALLEFAKQIEACIEGSDWESLSAILESRQMYLEQLFLNPSANHSRNLLKQLAQTILQQDGDFQVKLQCQKNLLSHQQSSIRHGRRAIDAYNKQ